MKKHAPISPNILESLVKVVADTNIGLTGSEISKFLRDHNVVDVDPTNTKWKRLYNAFVTKQNQCSNSNFILSFVQKSIHPSRFLNRKEDYFELLNRLNPVLSFLGIELTESGKYRRIEKSNTISDAEKRANRLIDTLKRRNVHLEVLTYCRAELLVDNYFHAVFEAVKSVADKIRYKSGIHEDGSKLVDIVFSTKNPLLKINDMSTPTELSEQKGFANLLKGMFGMFRNTVAHEPKIKWEINENDALDIFSLVSLLHRRLEASETT